MEPGGTFRMTSEIGKTASPWMRVDNVYGVHIYKTELDGWIADIELKTTPTGVPNIFGTHVSTPSESREESVESAVFMLAMIIRNTTDSTPSAPENNVFSFYEMQIPIPHEFVNELKELRETTMPDISEEYVIQRLEELKAKHGEITEEKMNSLSPDDNREVIVVCTMALLEGMFRWPESTPAPPKSMRN